MSGLLVLAFWFMVFYLCYLGLGIVSGLWYSPMKGMENNPRTTKSLVKLIYNFILLIIFAFVAPMGIIGWRNPNFATARFIFTLFILLVLYVLPKALGAWLLPNNRMKTTDLPEEAKRNRVLETLGKPRLPPPLNSAKTPEKIPDASGLALMWKRAALLAQARLEDVQGAWKKEDGHEEAKREGVQEAPKKTDLLEEDRGEDVQGTWRWDAQGVLRKADLPEETKSEDFRKPLKEPDLPEEAKRKEVQETRKKTDLLEEAKNREAQRAGKKMAALLAEAKLKAASDPEGGFEAYRQYRQLGGGPEAFTAAELYALAGRQPEKLFEDPMLNAEQALLIAELLSADGRHPEALRMLRRERLEASPLMEADHDAVIRIYARAGAIGDLVSATVAGKPDDQLLAFALALKRQNHLKDCLKVLKLRNSASFEDYRLMDAVMAALKRTDTMPTEEVIRPAAAIAAAPATDADCATSFARFVKEGRCDGARELFERALKAAPLASDPQTYYDFAALCEKSGFLPLAAEVYRKFIADDLIYLDVISRFQILKEGGRRTPPKAQAPEAPADSGIIGGKYEVGRQIGAGGMGVVFEGLDRTLSRKVAIKKMRAELRSDSDALAKFVQEARIISHLSHPYIVGIHEVVEERGETFLVFDYVDGKTLSTVLSERGHLTLKDCATIFGQVCAAVHCAHSNRVLHRDIKPSNIMLDTGGYAKVMDFGLAREAKESLSRLTNLDNSGTPAYMAPEQHLGRAGRESDIYALGVCLYEMLTGTLPFRGPDFLGQKERMKYPPPNFIVSGLPNSIELFMASVLNPDPKKRIGDALEFLDALKSVQAGGTV